jgi:hypothetical protein
VNSFNYTQFVITKKPNSKEEGAFYPLNEMVEASSFNSFNSLPIINVINKVIYFVDYFQDINKGS